MKITVECHAGYRDNEEPRAFRLGDRRLEVRSILDRWISPDRRYFKVAADDGNTYILQHDEIRDAWGLAAFRKGL